MADNSKRPIVIRRKKPVRHKPHGMWKIAYADFMTALMALFLVLWLLSSVNQNELEQISRYFRTPLVAAVMGGDKSSVSKRVIPGGGDNPIHSEGSEALTIPETMRHPGGPESQPDGDVRDKQRLLELKQQLETMINQDPVLKKAKEQLRVDITDRGLRIQIADTEDRPMFELGSADIEPYMEKVLQKIAPLLRTLPNRVMLIGHTDDLRYALGETAYSNWELSTDRANASRRALIAGGMGPDKVLRVVGAAATMRLPGSKPGEPANRRISILILNHDTTQRILNRGRDPIEVMHYQEISPSQKDMRPKVLGQENDISGSDATSS